MEMLDPRETGGKSSHDPPPVPSRELLSQAFTPYRPIHLPQFLAGRTRLLDQATDAVNSDGNHVVLFGDRGTGKTSLARVVAFQVQDPDSLEGRRSIFVSCSSEDDYSLNRTGFDGDQIP